MSLSLQSRTGGACPTAHEEAMMKTKIAAALALFAGVCMVAPSASADPPKKDNNYEYRFEDDGLLGKEIGSRVPVIEVLGKGRRDMLHRPRIQFVQEMLKSVENM
jgi:hypothetical protein